MRAPEARPSADEIAKHLAEELGRGEIPAIERALRLLDLFKPPNLAAIKKDFAGVRRKAERLREKYRSIPFLIVSLDGAIRHLDVESMSGPDPRFDWFGDCCARMAVGLILNSPNKRLGGRLRTVAGYLYWYVAGKPHHDLERACRVATPKRTNRASK